MQPVLMIGCGGSGSKAVRHVRHAVRRRLLEIDWDEDIPSCWRFLGIDTPTTQEASSEIPPLPSSDYLSIGNRHKSYPALFNALATQWQSARDKDVSLMSGWLPDPSKASFPLSKGAGQTRAIGRAAALDSFPRNVVEPLKAAFQDIRGSRTDLDKVTRALGYEMSGDADASNQDPLVVVCSSIGGGTGAGIALDVVDTLRAVDASGAHPVLVLFANDIFDLDTKDAPRSELVGVLVRDDSRLLERRRPDHQPDECREVVPESRQRPPFGVPARQRTARRCFVRVHSRDLPRGRRGAVHMGDL